MDASEIRRSVLSLLLEIAPEIEPDSIRNDKSLRDQVDIDSIDYLKLLTAIHERLGVEIPEADYARVTTLDDLVAYLAARRR
ncbi:MAG: phosphopantetheine-binding protein [bacterium]